MIHYLETNQRKLAYWLSQEQSNASRGTVLFIHGSGGDHSNWAYQLQSLRSKFLLAALDLPGHGRSEGPGESDVDHYINWVHAFLVAGNIRRPVLVGHSLGAAIALGFAEQHPDALSGLVAVGGGLTLPVNPLILEGLKKDPAPILEMAAHLSLAKTNRERLGPILKKSLTQVNPDLLHDDFLACSRFDRTTQAWRITTPTLVICGSGDKMTPPALSEHIHERIAGSRLSLIADAGHFVMMEQPETFNDTLTVFLSSLGI